MICVASEKLDVDLARSIEHQLGISCISVDGLSDVVQLLYADRLTAVAADIHLLQRDPWLADLVWQSAGTAVCIVFDSERQDNDAILRELRNAFLRRERNRTLAREEERNRLAQAFADPLTAMLVNLGIVLEDQKLARTTRIRIERVLKAAEKMQKELQSAPPKPPVASTRPAPAPGPALVKSAVVGRA